MFSLKNKIMLNNLIVWTSKLISKYTGVHSEKVEKLVRQFSKFALVGGLNTAIDIGLLNVLVYYSWPIMPANTVAFVVAVINSFFMNKYWTFGDTTGKWQTQLPFFVFVSLVGLGISNGFVYLMSLIFHFDLNLVKFTSVVLIFLWNFLAPKFLIFKK